ncbi:MAG TPA: hypothetical protein VFA18_25845 [Gemmataceae bacterium]|nr:hypothetical protein [Gemmataceae bacterium]
MTMNKTLWAVYEIGATEKAGGMSVVCEQDEWDALELAQPGKHKLIRTGITSEGEAERLARGTCGDSRNSTHKKKPS